MVENLPMSTMNGILSDSDLRLVSPYMEMYNHIISCKNLGILVNSDNLTSEDLDFLTFIQSEIETAHDKKRARKNKNGKR